MVKNPIPATKAYWPSVGDVSANALAIAWAKAFLGLDLLLIH